MVLFRSLCAHGKRAEKIHGSVSSATWGMNLRRGNGPGKYSDNTIFRDESGVLHACKKQKQAIESETCACHEHQCFAFFRNHILY